MSVTETLARFARKPLREKWPAISETLKQGLRHALTPPAAREAIGELQRIRQAVERSAILAKEQYVAQALGEARYCDAKRLEQYGFKLYSQYDEDGIVEEIFRRIGFTDRRFVEFGVEDGLENNTLKLLLEGWHGLWIEARKSHITAIRKRFADLLAEKRLLAIHALVTAENINDVVGDWGTGEIDLLSIDIDGNDFHVWQALTVIQPRVVVIEYNAKFRWALSIVQKYDAAHVWKNTDYMGASLEALVRIGRRLGYSLVGTNFPGVNAFFVRDHLTNELFQQPFSAQNHYNCARYFLRQLYTAGHPPDWGRYVTVPELAPPSADLDRQRGRRFMSLTERLVRFAQKSLPEKRLAIQATLYSVKVRLLAVSRLVSLMTLTQRELRSQLGNVDGGQGHPTRQPSSPLPPVVLPAADCIPRCIFQTWKSKTEFPPEFSYWAATFDKMNPDFKHIIWDDDDNRRFIADHYNWFLPIYNSYPREIYRADAIRYFFLYTFGGIYADMDAECLQPLERLLGEGDVLLGRMGSDPRHPHSIPNATMASRPRQEFWLWVIWMMIFTIRQAPAVRPDYATGPVVLKSAADLYLAPSHWMYRVRVRSAIRMIRNLLPVNLQPEAKRSCIKILPSQEWFPIAWTEPSGQELMKDVFQHGLFDMDSKRRRFSNASVVSYWSCSWGENNLKLKDS